MSTFFANPVQPFTTNFSLGSTIKQGKGTVKGTRLELASLPSPLSKDIFHTINALIEIVLLPIHYRSLYQKWTIREE